MAENRKSYAIYRTAPFSMTLQALLDFSATFDCVDHDILLSRLQSRLA